MDQSDDPNASLMNMLKNMYEEGDDEMKRSLQKAFYESQNKKEGGFGMWWATGPFHSDKAPCRAQTIHPASSLTTFRKYEGSTPGADYTPCLFPHNLQKIWHKNESQTHEKVQKNAVY